MSHNKFTVVNQSPNASGNVSLSLDNLDDVDETKTPETGQFFGFLGAKYGPTNASASLGTVKLFGTGSSVNYPQTLSSSDNVYFYSVNPINTIGATLLDSDGIGSNWYDGVTLPSGQYEIEARLQGDYTGSSGITTIIIKAGSTNIGCFGQDVDGANNSDYPCDAVAYVSLTSSTNIVVEIDSVTAANSSTSGAQSLRGYLSIKKVG